MAHRGRYRTARPSAGSLSIGIVAIVEASSGIEAPVRPWIQMGLEDR